MQPKEALVAAWDCSRSWTHHGTIAILHYIHAVPFAFSVVACSRFVTSVDHLMTCVKQSCEAHAYPNYQYYYYVVQ